MRSERGCVIFGLCLCVSIFLYKRPINQSIYSLERKRETEEANMEASRRKCHEEDDRTYEGLHEVYGGLRGCAELSGEYHKNQ